MRTFIAIGLDEAIRKNLAALIDELKPWGKDVRWVSPAGMHLTLKFLGEVSPNFSREICRTLDLVVGKHSPFGLVVRGTGVFPPGKGAPRVLWAGIEAGPGLESLHEEIEQGLEKLGLERERREFHPHLTLGRVKLPRRNGRLLAELEKHRERVFGRMDVSRVTFFQSFLKPEGAEYRALAEFNLK